MTHDPIRFRLTIYFIIFIAVVLGGAVCFKIVENRSWIDAFYFIIVTVATVGYGDVIPATPAGKIFAMLLIVLGVSTFLGVFANAAELVLSRREKQVRMRKLNMVIGVFFSEVGTKLIRTFSAADPHFDDVKGGLVISEKWSREDFIQVRSRLAGLASSIDAARTDFPSLKNFLMSERDFLVRLLENPALLDHESFTDLLRAVFHLTEELSYREDPGRTPSSDKAHLVGDIRRAYHLLVHQWLDYMEFLKVHYPYLFSLAMRTNPFDREATPVVK